MFSTHIILDFYSMTLGPQPRNVDVMLGNDFYSIATHATLIRRILVCHNLGARWATVISDSVWPQSHIRAFLSLM